MRSFLTIIIVLALILLATVSSHAAQCNVVTSAMSFGAYDPLSSSPTDTTTTVSISCRTPAKKPQIVTVQVSAGNSGTPAMRNLMSGGAVLFYNLFSDPGRSQVIGDGTSGSTILTRNVDRTNPWDVTLYGRIPALQVIPPGSYTDSLVVTLLW